MEQKYLDEVWSLLSFISEAPTQFHAVDASEALLRSNSFVELSLAEPFSLLPGGKYYVTKNRSSILAFRVPTEPIRGCMISAAHTDSPTFRLKPDFEMKSAAYLRLSTERYGGMILSSWLDRPLSVAGRVVLRDRDGGSFSSATVSIDRDLLIIPNVAIHFNRKINEGYAYSPATDMLPLAGTASDAGMLRRALAETLGVDEQRIVSADLSLYDRTGGAILGLDSEFFASPRIDNLECSYATLRGFLSSEPAEGILTVYASFDNEEVGSMTKQGADSPILFDLLSRIARSLGCELSELLHSTFLVSADNAHALHPNHPELSDASHAPVMNGGVVMKHNASQRYTTDAVSDAIFAEICRRADVPVQRFANRSDMPGGSTLGSVANSHLPVNTVDIGLAQLAMHSAYETAGVLDLSYMISAMKCFFSSGILASDDREWKLVSSDVQY